MGKFNEKYIYYLNEAMTVKEVSKRLNVSLQAIYKRISKGTIKAVKINTFNGHIIALTKDEVERLESNNKK